MSRVTYEPLGLQDVRLVSAVNSILADLETASSAIDGRNFGEEGLDQSVFQATADSETRSVVFQATRTTKVPQVFGAFAVPANMRTGALGALADGNVFRVRSLVVCETQIAAPSFGFANVNDNYEFRHAWFDGAATTAVIAGSRKSRGQIVQANTKHLHGAVLWESWLVGPIANVAWVEVQYQNVGAGNINVNIALLVVDEFKRVTVVT